MTAGLTPGDAVSNYAFNLARLFRQWGARATVYADAIAPQLQGRAELSHMYRPTGNDLLWFHYSIWADNVQLALDSPDFKIMDYHGICPPRLFAGQNAHLEYLCQHGLDVLPTLAGRFEQYVIHSEDSRRILQGHGFPAERLHKIFYTLDTAKYGAADDAELAALLGQMEYILLVGRIVPQKDVGALIDIFARLHAARPDMVLVLVGTRDQTKGYAAQLDRQIAAHGLTDRVLFAGQVNNPAVLGELYRHARLLFVTSEWESFCVPIAESLHFGVPVAVHDQEPMVEVAGPGGLVFDKRRPDEAAAQVLALLDDPARYAALRQAAADWARRYDDAALERNVLQFLSHVFDVSASVGQ
jgi:glycosyltransferase involved in cell wall biosynthesis